MSEAVQTRERITPQKTNEALGQVACAGCPFAALDCPKVGTGDCPPKGVLHETAATALQDGDTGMVVAEADGFRSIVERPLVAVPPPVVQRQPTPRVVPQSKRLEKLPTKPRLRGAPSLGEFAAALLLPVPKTK